MISVINSLLSGLNSGQMEDVVVSTDEKDIEKLKSFKLDNNLDYDCSICMGHMEKDEIVTELKCCHTFHTECINTYLKNYNYKCPICRAEVGKTKYNVS
jgi:DNA-directed RNA polymerase subunit RPC12/RpoP